jgi:NAD kinase
LQNDCDGATATIDGRTRLPMTCGDVLELTAAEVTCPLVKLPGASFYAALHNKLGWGGQPQYRR